MALTTPGAAQAPNAADRAWQAYCRTHFTPSPGVKAVKRATETRNGGCGYVARFIAGEPLCQHNGCAACSLNPKEAS